MDLFSTPARPFNRASAAALTRRPLSPHPHPHSTNIHTNILTTPSSAIPTAMATAMKQREPLKRVAASSSLLATPKRRKVTTVHLLTPPKSSPTSAAGGGGGGVKRPFLLAGRSSSTTLDLSLDFTPSSPLTQSGNILPSSPMSASIVAPSSPIVQRSRVDPILLTTSTTTTSNPLPIPFDGTFILIIGRSRHITPRQQPLLNNPELSSKLSVSLDAPLRFSSLPRGASHASRHHVALEYLASSGKIKLVVLGQNGCKVRMIDGQVKRFGQHRVVVLDRPSGAQQAMIEIDFYSCKVCIPWPATTAMTTTTTATTTATVQKRVAEPSSPLSSPVMGDRLTYPIRSSSVTVPFSSPLPGISSVVDLGGSSDLSSESEEDQEEEDGEEEGEEEEKEDDDVIMKSIKSRSSSVSASDNQQFNKGRTASAPSSPTVIVTHHRTSSTVESTPSNLPPPPADVDLVALIANTLVFSGHSASALPDVVKSIMETQPSLRELGSEQLWSAWVKQTLFAHPMFGKVDRKGKDVSGKSLLPLFFYLPAEDEDRQRAIELGSLVRPLRGVQQRGGKAIDWRPVGGGRRRRDGEGE